MMPNPAASGNGAVYDRAAKNLWNTLLLSELRIVSQFVGYYQLVGILSC